MLKALLIWAGFVAVRSPIPIVIERRHSDVAHAAANREQAIFSGAQLVAHRSLKLSEAMTSDLSSITHVNEGVDRMRNLMAEVARRAER